METARPFTAGRDTGGRWTSPSTSTRTADGRGSPGGSTNRSSRSCVSGLVDAYAVIALPNPASVGLHERLGFERVGVYERVGYEAGA